MKFIGKTIYDDIRSRMDLVHCLSNIIEGRNVGPENSFAPYMPNDNDDSYWTLDSGNNWKVKFNGNYPTTFEIRYRYSDETESIVRALSHWLAVRINVKVIDDEPKGRDAHRLTSEEEALQQMKAGGVDLTEDAQRRLDEYGRKPVTKADLDAGFKKFQADLIREYREMTGRHWNVHEQGPR